MKSIADNAEGKTIILDMICFEYLIPAFDKLVKWTDTGKRIKTCKQVYSLDDSDFINTNLSPGRNISFSTYYSVPVDAQSIELEYETNFWSGEKAIIKIQ